MGVVERRDFTLSLTDEETLRRPPLPFWHIDYFTQPQLDDPDFFVLPDECPPPEPRGPPVDVLGPPAEEPADVLRPTRLCPSPQPDKTAVDDVDQSQQMSDEPDMEAHLDWVSSSHSQLTSSSDEEEDEQLPDADETTEAHESEIP